MTIAFSGRPPLPGRNTASGASAGKAALVSATLGSSYCLTPESIEDGVIRCSTIRSAAITGAATVANDNSVTILTA